MKHYEYNEQERELLEGSCIPIAIYQMIDDHIVTVLLSKGFCELFGFDNRQAAIEVLDNNMYRNCHPDDTARLADIAYRFATEGGSYDAVYRTLRPDHPDYMLIHAHGCHVWKETGERLAIIWYTDEGPCSDAINPDEALNYALYKKQQLHSSHYDSLTGLPNMTHFFKMCQNTRKQMEINGQTAAMVFINFSDMSSFNRKHSYAEGDNLLRAFARLLADKFGSECCSRLEQDHFAIMARGITIDKQISELIEEIVHINDGEALPIVAGIYMDTDPELPVEVAYDMAKLAAASADSSQDSQIIRFEDSMLISESNRQYVLDNFDRALSEGWFTVFYQPIVRTSSGQVCDEEALARWVDPEKGMLSPADFIPILEDAKLIYKLDLYMLEQTLAKIRKQKAKGINIVPQSINLSRTDFESCDIVEEIRRRVDDAGIDRSLITVEITESVASRDLDFMKEQIERFHALGFEVWMDDFGSDYSSLNILRNLPFDLIKFDMRFMQGFDNSNEVKVILTELVKMAFGLGIETVMEGVEAREQVEFLKEIGCSKLQGFYYCKPIPIEKIFERYDRGEQIGLENPRESSYFTSIGEVNLYDPSVIANEDDSIGRYFNTLPMAIFESSDDKFVLVRCNSTYRDFMTKLRPIDQKLNYISDDEKVGSSFLRALRQCASSGKKAIVDEVLPDGTTIHAFLRRIAVNPVSDTRAVVVTVLAVMDQEENGTTYVKMAQALAADFEDLYYVNIDTEDFIEYASNPNTGELAVEHSGKNFFAVSRASTITYVHPSDMKKFTETFTKKNILKILENHGSLTLSYKIAKPGKDYRYKSMKVMPMKGDPSHIIIGVSDVDAQMRSQEMLEQLCNEHKIYSRLTALSGNYIALYTVDPKTNRYREYSTSDGYAQLGLPKEGDDFFAHSLASAENAICEEDRAKFMKSFNKERMLSDITERGVYTLAYHLVIDGEPRDVVLRAALVEEENGPVLIIGINDTTDPKGC